MFVRSIVRIVLTLFGLVCLFDGMLNAYRLYSLEFHIQSSLFPALGPFEKMGIGVFAILLGLVVGGFIERMAAGRKQKIL